MKKKSNSQSAFFTFRVLEGLIGFRSPALLDDLVHRDMFRLAHAHGTLLNLVPNRGRNHRSA
jgi:hypothetical protein